MARTRFHALVMSEESRLGREQIETAYLLKQLITAGVRVAYGRPPLGAAARRLIAIRIDPQVLDAVRREAKRRGLGYQSLINGVLAKHVRRVRSA